MAGNFLYTDRATTLATLESDPLQFVRFAEAYLLMVKDTCSLGSSSDATETIYLALHGLFISMAQSAESTNHPPSHALMWNTLARMVASANDDGQAFLRNFATWQRDCLRESIAATADTLVSGAHWSNLDDIATYLHLQRSSRES